MAQNDCFIIHLVGLKQGATDLEKQSVMMNCHWQIEVRVNTLNFFKQNFHNFFICLQREESFEHFTCPESGRTSYIVEEHGYMPEKLGPKH
jgi:hypothetical protein